MPTKTFTMKLAALTFMLFIGFNSSANAQTVAMDCAHDNITTTTQCKPTNKPVVNAELLEFAKNVFLLNKPLEVQSNCLLTGAGMKGGTSFDCKLNSPDPSSPTSNPLQYQFNCIHNADQTAEYSNCTLSNAGFENVMQMQCITKIDPTNPSHFGKCNFTVDTSPITDKIQSNLGQLPPNMQTISQAFFSCLNRSNDDNNQQFACDKLLYNLMDGRLGDQTSKELGALFKAITPGSTDLAFDMSAYASINNIGNALNRLSQLRSGTAQNSVELRYFANNQWLKPGTLMAANDSTTNDVSPSSGSSITNYGKLGIFVTGSAMQSKQKLTELESDNTADMQMATLGMDYRFTDNWIAGIGLNVSQSTSESGDNASHLDGSSTSIMLYNSFYIGQWYIDGSLHVGKDSYEQERNIACPTCPTAFTESFTAEFDGSNSLASIAGGYQWQIKNWSIAPYAQLNAGELTTDAYNESAQSTGPGASYALALNEQKRDTTTIKLGTNTQYAFNTNHGVILPTIGIAAVQELQDKSNLIVGRFAGNTISDASFKLSTNDIDANYFIVSTGLSFQLKNGNAGFIHIQSIEGLSNISQTQYTAGWRWEL